MCAIESLEQRLVFSTFTVNTLLDNTTSDSLMSLREAVALIQNSGDANAALGHTLTTGELAQIDTAQPYGTNDTIVFDSSIAGQTITLGSVLTITGSMTIDGGASGMTLSGGVSQAAYQAMNVSNSADLSLDRFTITNFSVLGTTSGSHGIDGQGGAIYFEGGQLTINRTTFSNNLARGGNGSMNGGTGRGGAVFMAQGNLQVTNSLFTQNIARGGARLSSSSGGQGQGGAIWIAGGTANISNSTFTLNQAVYGGTNPSGSTYGGAIFSQVSTLSLDFDTFSTNTANNGRSLCMFYSATMTNTLMGQADNSQEEIRSFGSLSGTNNLVRNTAVTGIGVVSSADPMLGALADNGGPTQTMALLAGSPAIDAAGATSVTTDQRGALRVNNGVADIGAYESYATATVNAPAITSADHATIYSGQTVAFTFTTTGSPTAALSEVGALPTGVTFTDNGDGTATLGGSTSLPAHGVFAITVTADNGATPAVSQTFTLTLLQTTVITSADHATFTASTLGSFTVTTAATPTAAIITVGTLPSGITVTDNGDGTATLAGMPIDGDVGAHTFTLTIAPVVITLPGAPIVTSAIGGAGDVRVTNLDGTARFTIADPFTTRDATRFATGDITGDGASDIILAAGAGGHSMINVYDGTDGTLVHSFAAFSRSFTGTMYVACADVNHDGIADIVVGKGRDKKSLASFKVFDGTNFSLMANVIAFGSRGDARVAAADLDGDGFADVVVTQGSSKARTLARVFSGAGLATNHVTVLSTLTPFGSQSKAGAFVAIGDVNHDGQADLIFAKRAKSLATVAVFSGDDGSSLTTFTTPSTVGGTLASKDVNNDGYSDIFIGVTDSTGRHVKIFSGLDHSLLDTIDLNVTAGLFAA